MTEISRLNRTSDRTFILVCLNFVMLFVLFCGLGYVAWQSAALIDALQDDLDKAEKTVAELRGRIQEMDIDLLMDRVTEAAVEKLRNSVVSVVEEAEFVNTLQDLSEKVDSAQYKLDQTGESIRAINDRLQQMDAESLGQAVSYHMLKGLGEGFNQAADTQKPLKP